MPGMPAFPHRVASRPRLRRFRIRCANAPPCLVVYYAAKNNRGARGAQRCCAKRQSRSREARRFMEMLASPEPARDRPSPAAVIKETVLSLSQRKYQRNHVDTVNHTSPFFSLQKPAAGKHSDSHLHTSEARGGAQRCCAKRQSRSREARRFMEMLASPEPARDRPSPAAVIKETVLSLSQRKYQRNHVDTVNHTSPFFSLQKPAAGKHSDSHLHTSEARGGAQRCCAKRQSRSREARRFRGMLASPEPTRDRRIPRDRHLRKPLPTPTPVSLFLSLTQRKKRSPLALAGQMGVY